MQRLLTTCSILSLAALLAAQQPGMRATPPPPPPMPQAIPVTAPPVDHPAYAGQPLMPRSSEPTSASPRPRPKAKKKDKKRFVPPAGPVPGAVKPAAPAGPDAAELAAAEAEAALAAAKEAADAFNRTKIEGKELKTRVDRVLKQLHWNETLEAAAVEACASDKPIVWVQMLGDVDGFT